MALESLFTDAFRRGCGISRTYALRTPRYKELCATASRVPNTTQAETAEMIYLGERLADRAFANLPYAIRKRAEQWPDMTDVERQGALNMLVTRLTTSKWLRIRKLKKQRPKAETEVLPAEYGSWSRGKTQPNCLGLSQMLIGFARATGAEHLMVDVITQHNHYTEELTEQMIRKMTATLRPYEDIPGIARMIRRLDVHYKRSLRILTEVETTSAHHALLIRVGSDWMLVDPYMGVKYTVDALGKTRAGTHEFIMKHPRRRWMVSGGHARKYDYRAVIESLEHVVSFLDRREEPASSFGFTDVVSQACGVLCWIGIDPRGKKFPTRVIVEELFWRVMINSLLTRDMRKVWPRGNQKATKSQQRWYNQQVRQSDRTKRARNAAMVRLIRFICLTGLDISYEAAISRKTDHRRIEVTHPALHLGAMTLNHIGHKTGQPTAELLRFDISQWIVHDTLEEVKRSGNKRLTRISDAALNQLQKYPHQVMPALLVEINKREVSNGEAQEAV